MSMLLVVPKRYKGQRVTSDATYLNLMLTYGIPPGFRGGVQSRVYRVTQLRTDGGPCRESAGTGPVNLKVLSERVLPWQVTLDQLVCASLSHTHYWYEMGMLKIPAANVYLYTVSILNKERAQYREGQSLFYY